MQIVPNGFRFCLQHQTLTDTGEDSKLVHRLKRPKVDTLFSSLFFRRVRATSMTQNRVENTRVHFWTLAPVSVNVRELRFLPFFEKPFDPVRFEVKRFSDEEHS